MSRRPIPPLFEKRVLDYPLPVLWRPLEIAADPERVWQRTGGELPVRPERAQQGRGREG